jgi:hypothetical protein
MTDEAAGAIQPAPFEVSDADALRCPKCDYNLTGLTEQRCPECGEPFDLDALRRIGPRSTFAFERARGWRMLPAFFVSWLQALLAPWIFARHVVSREPHNAQRAVVFGTACFLSPISACAIHGFDADSSFIIAWTDTAMLCVLIEMFLFTLLDPLRRRRGWRVSMRFWFCVACYTSAVMPTEVQYGPPPLILSELLSAIRKIVVNGDADPLRDLLDDVEGWVYSLQILAWSVAITVVYYCRRRRAGFMTFTTLVCCAVLFVGLILLYAALCEHVGMNIWDFFQPGYSF